MSHYYMHLEIGNIGIQLPVSSAVYLHTYCTKQYQVFILHVMPSIGYCSMNKQEYSMTDKI